MARKRIIDISLSKAIEGHLLWCAGQNYSQNTITGYQYVGNIFLGYLGDVSFGRITVADVEGFMRWAVETPVTPAGAAYRGTRKRKPKTLRNYQIALASLWSWGVAHDFAREHVLHEIKPVRVPDEPIEPLSNSEIVQLVNATKESRPWRNKPLTTARRSTEARDRMIVMLLLDTMVRASEAVHLRIEDVTLGRPGDWGECQLKVKMGKGKKTRLIPFARRCADAVFRYLATRPKALPTDYLIVQDQTDNEPISRGVLTKLVSRLGEKAGITRVPVSPHRLRTTGACQHARNGISAVELQRMMGHASINTTMAYIRAAQINSNKTVLTTSPVDNLRL